ncbi:MAG TPA: NAD-dependent succinate-semialdehyde dehydrogenase [Acidobacteriaceae bacterium]
MAIQSINPANGELLRSFEPLSDDALQQKIAIAAAAAKSYRETALNDRALWMRKLAVLIEQEADELAALMTSEMGKPIAGARAEALKCATGCRYYAENAGKILAPEVVRTEASRSYVRYDPLGVILAIMPWNYPLWQVFRFAAPTLMAGNVGLLKHASNVPQCALAIEALIRRAGFPRGSFQTLLIGAQQVEAVIADKRVAAVTVTGSERAGKSVAAQAGWLLKKTVMELGGSDPFIVMPTADLQAAVTTAIKARTVNTGQSCIAGKRFIVDESVYDVFEKAFVTGMRALKVGDPMLPENDLGPLATPAILDELQAQVKATVAAGGKILCGGERVKGKGNFFQPTVIAGVPRGAAIAREEFFGPVALLYRVSGIDDAIELANDTPFGLGASAWTRDPAEQQRFVAELEVGTVYLNGMVRSDPRLPFGGVKSSGYGRELSAAGMREFMNTKTVVIA